MPKTSVTVDNTEILGLIEEQISRLDNPQPLLKTVGRYIQKETMRMFEGKRPDAGEVRGEKWDRLAPSTIMKKIQLRKKDGAIIGALYGPLVRTAKMMDSLKKRSAVIIKKKGLMYGTDVKNKKGFPYPAIHQVGSDKINLPKRRFLFITEEDLIMITLVTRDYVLNLLSKQTGIRRTDTE